MRFLYVQQELLVKIKSVFFNYNPIINADFLYESMYLLKNSSNKIQKQINILEYFSQTEWIKLPFNQAFETYCLVPNINPLDFINNLKRNTLSDTYKQFLKDVGFSLENSTFSRELQNTIKEINDLFLEDR